jgi:hypothetical protein
MSKGAQGERAEEKQGWQNPFVLSVAALAAESKHQQL